MQRLEKEMIQEKCDVEDRIAVPRNFAVQQYHAVAANQYVLGAEISMHQRFSRGFNPPRLGIEERAQRRMPLSCGEQIRLDAKLVKILRCVELFQQSFITGCAAMDFTQDAPGEPGPNT
jgi:hypothetical protein